MTDRHPLTSKMSDSENQTLTSSAGTEWGDSHFQFQGMKRKRYVGSPRRMGSSNGSRFSYDAPPDTPSAPQGKRRPEARRFYPSCLTGEAPEIRNTALRRTMEKETDMHKVHQRQKQVDYGKNTLGYERYCQQVKKSERRPGEHPSTPDASLKMSNRRFNGLVRAWRRTLHMYDPEEGAEEEEEAHLPATACATPASEARTDRSFSTGGSSSGLRSRGGKVIFSPGDDDEEDDDLDFNFLQRDDDKQQSDDRPRQQDQRAAREQQQKQDWAGSKTDDEEDDDRSIRFMDVDDDANQHKPAHEEEEEVSDDDML